MPPRLPQRRTRRTKSPFDGQPIREIVPFSEEEIWELAHWITPEERRRIGEVWERDLGPAAREVGETQGRLRKLENRRGPRSGTFGDDPIQIAVRHARVRQLYQVALQAVSGVQGPALKSWPLIVGQIAERMSTPYRVVEGPLREDFRSLPGWRLTSDGEAGLADVVKRALEKRRRGAPSVARGIVLEVFEELGISIDEDYLRRLVGPIPTAKPANSY